MNSQWVINSGDQRVLFTAESVMPQEISLKAFDGSWESVAHSGKTGFSITKCNGVTSYAVPLEEPEYYSEPDRQLLIFGKVGFKSGSGELQPELFAQLEYEFMPDGVAFVTVCFIIGSDKSESYKDLKVSFDTDMGSYDDVRWAFLHRKRSGDGAMIQDSSPKRYQERGRDFFRQELSPVVNFNGFRQGKEALYAEFFLEGGATLSGKAGENSTNVSWKNGSPSLEWNFQSVPASKNQVAMQMRNCWGWVIKHPPRVRHLPPFQMYQYLDLDQRFPTDAEVEAMADAGADILVLHENWRHDLQNDGIPQDRDRFLRVIELAHKHNMRVAPYIRGNEDSATIYDCEWFDRHLKKDWDGLYMDYGSPLSNKSDADENFVDGRINFRQYYRLFSRLRQRVGRDGVFFSHTGPWFGGVGMNITDGYISGEGERGMLIRSRQHHEYFSMAAVSCGTMWTAAFPEYSTSAMVPFLAATGQYPHSPLGEQFPTSSLAHPREAGINDVVFRPLWKLWKMVKHERDLNICNDYNSRGVFPVEPECGHYMMSSADGRRALLVVSNFAAEEKTFDVTPAWENSGFSPAGKKCWLLAPQMDAPGTEELYTADRLSVTLAPDGCAAFYFSDEEPDFTEYRRAYHQLSASGIEFAAHLAKQKELREAPPAWEQVNATCFIAKQTVFGYEDSMIVDLYVNESYLVKFADDGTFTKLVPILRADGKSLFSGDRSVSYDLKKILGPGYHKLGVYATHYEEPFYSFFGVTLDNGAGESYDIVFRNDLEPDRAFLHFTVNIK